VRTAALTLILMLLSQGCSAQTDLYLIALMGQSNMEGRGELSELPAGFPANPTRLWNFTNAYKWEPAKEPIDSPEGQVDVVSIGKRGGVGPGWRSPTPSCQLIPQRRLG
jgi:Carbohydrate esterase, sialic acid-specific acetylesterase